MKRNKIIYWTATILFAGFMISTAIPDLMRQEEALKFITDLGYPIYFIIFISLAKVAGSITILIPGKFKLKEWAYAGLFYDLAGAVYSLLAVHGFDPGMIMMPIIIAVMFTSYFYNEKVYGKQ